MLKTIIDGIEQKKRAAEHCSSFFKLKKS